MRVASFSLSPADNEKCTRNKNEEEEEEEGEGYRSVMTATTEVAAAVFGLREGEGGRILCDPAVLDALRRRPMF